MRLALPRRLTEACARSPEGRAWLRQLPACASELGRRWSLAFEPLPPASDATCSCVVFVRRADGAPAVLKLGLPHMEAEHELAGLLFWDGDPSVRVLAADARAGALLLERCEPGLPLSTRPESEQDDVLAGLLRRLWRAPPAAAPFRPLLEMARHWTNAALAERHAWPDAGWVRAGIELFHELAQPAPSDVLLATDLHAGNVLSARRAPWMVIDPKPFVGDAAYDTTQHLLNGMPRLCVDPAGTVTRFAERLEVSPRRVRCWLIARLATEARVHERSLWLLGAEALELARRLEKAGI